MTPEELKKRTKNFALEVMKLIRELPSGIESSVISHQLIRAATSVAANYRAACRTRSHAEFLSKIKIVEEEADESSFWLELVVDAKLLSIKKVQPCLNESSELTAIFSATAKTTKLNYFSKSNK
ncbi:MAG: four helix bundle protein [Bacteroidota bacterium]